MKGPEEENLQEEEKNKIKKKHQWAVLVFPFLLAFPKD